jgi:hypothetical protein
MSSWMHLISRFGGECIQDWQKQGFLDAPRIFSHEKLHPRPSESQLLGCTSPHVSGRSASKTGRNRGSWMQLISRFGAECIQDWQKYRFLDAAHLTFRGRVHPRLAETGVLGCIPPHVSGRSASKTGGNIGSWMHLTSRFGTECIQDWQKYRFLDAPHLAFRDGVHPRLAET